MELVVLVGIFRFPVFTLAGVLLYYQHPVLAAIAFCYSLYKIKWQK